MATRVNPTFLLKGIDPNVVIRDYVQGKFSRQPIQKEKIQIAHASSIIAPTYGNSNHLPVFAVQDRNNGKVIYATTGHEDLEVFTRTGDMPETGGRCLYCVRDYTGMRTGYPIAYQEQTVLTNASMDPRDAKYRVFYTFWVEGSFCSYECALSYLNLHGNKSADYRDPTMRDAEQMLHQLYNLIHPNSGVLHPSQDHRLLKCNGGSLTDAEWGDVKHQYRRTDRILLIPAKVEYLQQHFPGHTITELV